MSTDGRYRVCKDRSGDELLKLGFVFGLHRLDERMALRQTVLSDIKYAFLPGTKYVITRYGDGTWPVLYTAADWKTAICEVAYHSRKEWRKATSRSERCWAKKILYHVTMKSKNGLKPRHTVGMLDPIDYSSCHNIARKARLKGYHFIDVPSVRNSGGECRPIFEKLCVEPDVGIETKFLITWLSSSDELYHNAGRDKEVIHLWHK